jgi:hypothetical protein
MTQADVGQFKVYNLQRQFIAFLEIAGLREEKVPKGNGEVVFYNLGKFSQAISDFERIHFHSNPVEKYASFAGFLRFHAEKAYPEGWQDNAFVSPDAVRIMTVHQAKGLQWPAVFIPQLVRNTFPSRAVGGRTAWHLIPQAALSMVSPTLAPPMQPAEAPKRPPRIAPAIPPIAAPAGPATSPIRAPASAPDRAADAPAAAPATVPIALPILRPTFLT